VQNYFTTFVDYNEADEAIKMDQIDELLAPLATRIVTDLELDFATFMMINSGLKAGDVDTPVTDWGEVANAGAVLTASGVPQDAPWYYAVNPFTQVALASAQRSLGAGGSAGSLIVKAYEDAVLTKKFAGFSEVLSTTTLASFTTDNKADRAGTLTAAPTLTYVGAKDTMTQVLAVTAFTAATEVRAGEIIQITGRNRLNLSTRKPMVDASGNKILFTGVVTEAVTLGSSGEGNITVTGPAIWETGGAYNTTDTAVASGDVVTLLGTASTATLRQPNLFWHKNAFSIGSVPIKKLHSTDTIAQTKDGLQFRVSKGAQFLQNINMLRIDFRPAYAVLNPFFAGQGFGIAT
jgi:hypothetical protein